MGARLALGRVHSYEQINAFLAGRKARTIGNNTVLTRTHTGAIALLLHGSAIVQFTPDAILLSDCGYATVTTAARFRSILDACVFHSRVNETITVDGVELPSWGYASFPYANGAE